MPAGPTPCTGPFGICVAIQKAGERVDHDQLHVAKLFDGLFDNGYIIGEEQWLLTTVTLVVDLDPFEICARTASSVGRTVPRK